MGTMWQIENFSRGLHTKPARIEGGDSYAADIENLQVDGDGFLRLRSNFMPVGPGGANITGIAASEKYLFVLREDSALYRRDIGDLDSEVVIPGVSDLKGRISVVSTFRDYVVLTSEGEDQGFWIDLREDKELRAYSLGIAAPELDDLKIIPTVPPFETDNDTFLVYAISYVREFEAGDNEVPSDDLFNGAESKLSPPQYIFTRQNQMVRLQVRDEFEFEDTATWTWTNNQTVGDGEMGRDGDTLIVSVIDSDGRDHSNEFMDAQPRMEGSQLRAFPSTAQQVESMRGVVESATISNTHIRLSLNIIADTAHTDGFAYILELSSAAMAAGIEIETDDYFPAILQFTHSSDPQVTGINVYRSHFFKDSEEYERIRALIDNDDPNLDLNSLEFRKIGSIAVGDDKLFADGIDKDEGAYTLRSGESRIGGVISVPLLQGFAGGTADRKQYVWMDEARYEQFQNERLPAEAKQIHYHHGRIFAPVGDRLIYSDYDGTTSKIWTFPPTNEVRRTRPGRVDFCASYREVLLFGGYDGLYRLTGSNTFDFDSDEISGVGPLDGYSWGTLKNSLGFVGNRGLYLTDASDVQFLSDEVLDGFFDAKTVEHGSVIFFDDNTILFFVRLKSMEDGELTDSFFLFDDRHWIRWSGEAARQFASNAGRFYVAGGANLVQIQWREAENTDANLPWAWESNLIHGQQHGVGNITKRFAELLLSAAEETAITLKTWVDTQQNPIEHQFKTRDDLHFQRIPIERIGKRFRFRLEGTGPVEIRGLQIEGEI